MPERPVDPREFWEKKILAWEEHRYSERSSGWPLLERIASRASDSIRFRLSISASLLAPHVAGKSIVDLGCGSGLLAPLLIEAGARQYLGYDIAANAVSAARRRAAVSGSTDRMRFEQIDVGNLPHLDADIVVSLGLFDWLSFEEIDRVFAASGGAEFLHTISERRSTPSQWIHRLYVYLSYGHSSGAYVPRYDTVEAISDIAARHGHQHIHTQRDPRMSFGVILTSLARVG